MVATASASCQVTNTTGTDLSNRLWIFAKFVALLELSGATENEPRHYATTQIFNSWMHGIDLNAGSAGTDLHYVSARLVPQHQRRVFMGGAPIPANMRRQNSRLQLQAPS
jgi:hypothetical protein